MLAQLDDISAFPFKCSHKVTNLSSVTGRDSLPVHSVLARIKKLGA